MVGVQSRGGNGGEESMMKAAFGEDSTWGGGLTDALALMEEDEEEEEEASDGLNFPQALPSKLFETPEKKVRRPRGVSRPSADEDQANSDGLMDKLGRLISSRKEEKKRRCRDVRKQLARKVEKLESEYMSSLEKAEKQMILVLRKENQAIVSELNCWDSKVQKASDLGQKLRETISKNEKAGVEGWKQTCKFIEAKGEKTVEESSKRLLQAKSGFDSMYRDAIQKRQRVQKIDKIVQDITKMIDKKLFE